MTRELGTHEFVSTRECALLAASRQSNILKTRFFYNLTLPFHRGILKNEGGVCLDRKHLILRPDRDNHGVK